jgi:hypothetical protein
MAAPHVLTGLSKRRAELTREIDCIRLPTGFVGHGSSRRGDSPKLSVVANPAGAAATPDRTRN